MKKHFTLITLLFVGLQLFSQTIEMSNIYRFSPRNTGYIYENNSLAGYYVFYATEKLDKKNMAYEITFYDNNLNQATSYEIIRNKKSQLLEAVYNQNAFMLMFYEKDEIEFITYDRDGKEIGSKKLTDISKWEKYRISSALADPDAENTTVFPIGNSGFVRQTFAKNDKLGYEIESYNNDMSVNWTYGSDTKSDVIETADIVSSSEKYIALAVIKKKNQLTRNFDTYFILLDATNGKELCNIPVRDNNDGEMSLLNVFVDEQDNTVLLLGEFYKPGDEVLKDNSMGIYARKIDIDGSDIHLQKYGWKKEIASFKQENLSEEDKDSDKGKSYIWFHKFVKSSNGNIFAIGEQYRKQVSAAGVAMNMLNRNADVSNFEIKITNMVVVEFDKELNIVDYDIVQKKRSTALLPEGYGLASPQSLAYYVKARGFFDYQFTSAEASKDKYQVVYTDLDRKEEKDSKTKADVMIGVINIDKGEKTTQRIPINSEAKRVWYAPAKPGYIMVGEYFRKERKVLLHLEKITY